MSEEFEGEGKVMAERKRVRRSVEYSYYEDGNAVRKIPHYREEVHRPRVTSTKKAKPKRQKLSVKERRTLQTGKVYVMVLTIAIAMVVFCSVSFLQLKVTLTNQSKAITSLKTELNTLQSENDALYDKTMNSVDIDEIKEYAMTNLGMKYAGKEQIVEYTLPGDSYFRQYQSVVDSE